MKKLEFYLLLILILFTPPSSIAGDPKDNKEELAAIQEEIESTRRLLEAERADHQREKEEESLVKERLGQEIKEMKERQKELKQLKKELEDQISQLSRECEMLINKKDSLDEELIDLRKVLVDFTRSFRTQIEKGFPYNKEIRSADLLILEKDLEGERVENLEGINRLWDLIEHEISLGSESEVYPGDLPQEEIGVRGVRYLRLGMVSLAYVSEDGKEVGLLIKKDGDYIWMKDLNKDLKDSIKETQHILEGRSAFRLVYFPIDLSLLEIPGTSFIEDKSK
ncbi:MAG: DUF3450 family protein [Deltaproteobacteria bacterium]|nr:MAG: DUF3450 family protein [Deltaproteobacteria bacterium]